MRFFDNPAVIFHSSQPQVQLSTLKQTSCPVVDEVAKSTGIGLDEPNRTIESFSTRIANPVTAAGEQAGLMAPAPFDHFFNRLQLTPHVVVGPCNKEPLGNALVALAAEMGERLLDAPGPTGLEVELIEGSKRHRPGAAFICILLEPHHMLPVKGEAPSFDKLRCACLLAASTASPKRARDARSGAPGSRRVRAASG